MAARTQPRRFLFGALVALIALAAILTRDCWLVAPPRDPLQGADSSGASATSDPSSDDAPLGPKSIRVEPTRVAPGHPGGELQRAGPGLAVPLIDRRDVTPAPVEPASASAERRSIAYHPSAGFGPSSVAWSDRTSFNPRDRPTRPTRQELDRALRWLAAHQRPDGSWSADDADAWCDGEYTGTRTAEARIEPDLAVTALALLAFLGTGGAGVERQDRTTPRSRALAFLLAQQGDDGRFSLGGVKATWSTQAVVAVAMLEATGPAFDPVAGAAARSALDWVVSAPESDRSSRAAGELDAGSWLALALHELRYVRVRVEDRVHLLIEHDAPVATRLGALVSSEPLAPRSSLFRMLVLEGTAAPEADVSREAKALSGRPPVWAPDEAGPNVDDWFFTDLSLLAECYGWRHQTYDRWKRFADWHVAMHRALLGGQRPGDRACSIDGTWDPVGAHGPAYGRAGATCLCILALDAADSQGRMFFP